MSIPFQSNRFRITLMLLVFALATVLGSIGRAGRTESIETAAPVRAPEKSKAQPVSAISWDGEAGDNLWHTKRNWEGDVLPTSSNDVSIPAAASVILTPSPEEGAVAAVRSLMCNGNLTIINGARLQFSADSSINGTLTLGSDSPLLSVGTLHGVDDGAMQTMTLVGPLNWIGGTISGDGEVNTTSGITMSSGLGKELRGPTLNNSVTANWSGAGDIAIGSSGTNLGRFNNTGTFNANTDADFNLLGAAQGFYNDGNFVKNSVGTTTFSNGVPFHNTGTVSVQNGTLELRGGGASTGGFTPSASGAVQFAAGNYQLNNGANIGGAGFGVVTGATVTVSGNITAGFFALFSGNIDGAGTLTVSDFLQWTGGTMNGTGVINANGDLLINSDAGKELFCTLNSAGTATWTDAGNIGLGDGAVFNNIGTFNASSPGSFTHAGGTPASFNNQGNFNLLSSNLVSTRFSQNVAFNNTGMVTVERFLILDGGGTTTQPGAFDARGSAGVEVSSGTYTLDSAAFFGEGDFRIEGGVVEVRGTVAMSNLLLISGTLTGAGVLDVFGDLRWTGGTMGGSGLTNADGRVEIDSLGTILKRRTLNTRGNVTWRGSGNIGMEAEGGVGATFNNFGNFTAENDRFFGVVGASGTFNNFGTFTKSGSSGTTTFLVPVTNTGTATAASGIINFARGYNQAAGALLLAGGGLRGTVDLEGGSLGGVGNHNGNVNNTGGTTIVGASPGQISITGNYTQGAAGALAIEIGGAAPGTQFDQLNVSATANLGGALAITLINGFAPNVGDSFQILSYASRTGSFARIAGLVLPQGRVFTPSFTGTSLLLIASAIDNSQSGPTLTSAATSNGNTNVRGTFFGLPNTSYTISFFLNSTCDPSSGSQTFFGSTTVTTDSSGNASFNVTFPTTVPAGLSVTAIATGPNNNVSQFSECIIVEGSPTAIELSSFTATGYDDGVLLQWQTGFEVDNLGFNIYREEAGNRVPVNKQIIAGSALVAGSRVAVEAGESYAWWDGRDAPTRREGDTATVAYWLEDVDLSGQSTWHGPFYAIRVKGQPPAHSQAAPLTRLGLAQSNAVLSRSVDAIASAPFVSPQQTEQQSLLASRSAVKISVKREGFYRISQPDLVRAGLPSKSDPRLLQLFVEGREVPILVRGPDASFDENSSIEFYGMGLDTPATDERIYWLVVGDKEGKRISALGVEALPTSSGSFPHTVERRDRSIYFAALKNGERENFFGSVVASTGVAQTLRLSHLHSSASEQAVLEVALQGVTGLPHRVMVELNELRVGEINFTNQEQGTARFALQHSMLREGANAVRLVSMNGPSDISLIDYLRLSYQHTFTADDDWLRFGIEGNESITIAGFSSNAIRVFDVTDEGRVTELKGEVKWARNGYSITVAAAEAGDRTLLALTDDAASKPDAVKADLASSWRSANNQANFVIIAPREFFPALEPLSMLRQSQGYRVALVDIEDIYDEFNFGNKSPQSIKDFLSVARSSWKIRPGFVMFAADASFDSRNYLGPGSGDIVPTGLVDTDFLETASDDWLADFDNDGIADLAVGRLPARTVEEATGLVRKIVGYHPSKTVASALLVSDANDGFDFEQASAQLRPMLEPRLRVEELHRGRLEAEQAKARLIAAINQGQRIINYVGHGSANQWRGNLLTSEEGRALKNESLPVIVMMTCLNGYFHGAESDSLAESLIKAEHGGAVAAWSSSGVTLPHEQAEMNKQLYRVLFEAESKGLSLGEAVQKAKHSIRDSDIRRTWILLGDPTLRLN